jgi:hypothetical protein
MINIPFPIEKYIIVYCLISLPFPPNLLDSQYFSNSPTTDLIAPTLYRLLTFHVPNLMSFVQCLGHAKESVQVWGALKQFITIKIFTVRGCGPTPNPQAGGPPLVGCPRLLIQHIRSYPPYLEDFPPSTTWFLKQWRWISKYFQRYIRWSPCSFCHFDAISC